MINGFIYLFLIAQCVPAPLGDSTWASLWLGENFRWGFDEERCKPI